MPVDFQVEFVSEDDGVRFAREAEKLGYRISVFEGAEEQGVCVECTIDMILTYDEVVARQKSLDTIAGEHGGYLDGWGTLGNRTEEPFTTEIEHPEDPTQAVIDRVEELGSDLSKPMQIEFAVFFRDGEPAETFAQRAQEQGYLTKIIDDIEFLESPDNDPEDDNIRFTVECAAEIILSAEEVHSRWEILDAIASDLGGWVDGWATSGNHQDPVW